MSAPVLHRQRTDALATGEARSLLQESLGLGRIGVDVPGNLPQSRFSTFQSTQLDLGSHASRVTSFDPWDSN